MGKQKEQGSTGLQEKVFTRINEGLGSFSVTAPLTFLDEYASTNGIFYHFMIGDVPVSCYGFNGKYAKENLEGILCRACGEIRVNAGREGGKPFVNLSADSIVKVYLP